MLSFACTSFGFAPSRGEFVGADGAGDTTDAIDMMAGVAGGVDATGEAGRGRTGVATGATGVLAEVSGGVDARGVAGFAFVFTLGAAGCCKTFDAAIGCAPFGTGVGCASIVATGVSVSSSGDDATGGGGGEETCGGKDEAG